MSEYFNKVTLGLHILFGNEEINVKRNKNIDTKKELRMARAIKKTSIIQRSTNRIKKIAREAIG
ncbi:MAG: hypothetical protein ACMV1K_13455 [Sulfurospirillum sp.]